MKKNIKLYILIALFAFTGITGCKKYIDVEVPVTRVSELSAYESDATAIAVLNGIYASMNTYSVFSSAIPSVSKFGGLSSDELTLYSGVSDPGLIAYYTNSLTAIPATGSEMWNTIYPSLYKINAAIEGISKSAKLSTNVSKQLLAEAYYLRAFNYFYLVNLYGDVPLLLNTDYEKNRLKARSAVSTVYQQIISDLTEAKNNLSNDFLDATLKVKTTEKVRLTKSAASALLSRVYLYTGEWQKAITESQSVIGSGLFSLVQPSDVFLKNSNEAIWQMQPVVTGFNTQEAVLYVLPQGGPNSFFQTVSLNDALVNSFEVGDKRRTEWVGTENSGSGLFYYANKYKVNLESANVTTPGDMTEYLMVFRLAEMYLISAEAKAQSGDLAGARTDLNIIRTRAGLPAVTANDKATLLNLILKERRVELFTEWGHRWFDIKRSSEADNIMTAAASAKGGVWKSIQKLYPIPQSDRDRNVNLSQNPGY